MKKNNYSIGGGGLVKVEIDSEVIQSMALFITIT